MPIRRIGRLPRTWAHVVCRNPDHSPNMMDLPPGTYEHTCPGCHKKTVFTVGNGVTL